MRVHVLLIVPAADRERANADAWAYDPDGGGSTFRAGLSPTGEDPATHYWAAANVEDATYQAMRDHQLAEYPAGIIEPYDLDADSDYPHRRRAELGLELVPFPDPEPEPDP